MCGIVGYVGKADSLQVLIDGLKRLEYRGYDSAGVAFLDGRGLEVYKTKGKLRDLQRILPDPLPHLRAGLGHTRWATHGAPSSTNAHPHHVGGVAVVHNGIIENYHELKSRLQAEGHSFLSETDTEVIPQMISGYLKEGLSLRAAIEKTLPLLRGSYALGIVCEAVPETLFAIRKGSPLVIGIGERGYYCASDVPALLPYTNKFVFMEDGQMCVMMTEGMEIIDLASKTTIPVRDKTVEISWTPAMAEKGGHDHFMHKEIFEQPAAIMDTVGEWIDNPVRLLDSLGICADGTSGVKRLQIVACGTSYHAALVGKYMIENLARVPVEVDIASEYRYREPIIDGGTLFMSITQSGETADTLAAQREAKDRGARALTVCNVVGSTSSREADAVLYTHAGPEIGVASTKAFTAQMAALTMLAICMGLGTGGLSRRDADEIISSLLALPACVKVILAGDEKIRKLSGTLTDSRSLLYLGRGINYPIALEGALKLKEISYIHAEGYPAGEMKHGPIALIEENLPVIVVASLNSLLEKTLSNIEEVKARGGRVIVVTDSPVSLGNKADEVMEVPHTHPLLSPFVSVIPLQLLAYHVGVIKGCDVDQPRNLAKSVTVE